jgi:acetyl-CoA carboxylase carboxyltransferase component
MDMREVLLRILDGSRFDEFKPLYGVGLITGWAHIHGLKVRTQFKLTEGHHIGIVANQTPVIFTNESKKAVQFIRLCNQASIPILFMHNVTGFMVGKKTEREGLVKSGALFVDAVSRSQVPHLSIICGASYGAGNYAVSSPSISQC